jgi:hypothetical protein
MKCYKQPKFLEGKPTPIAELWEVRIPSNLWRKIKYLARLHRTTYSTITRFCAFQLAMDANLHWHKKLLALKKEDNCEYKAGGLHRHMMCLYGQDAKMLRLAAIELGISVSALIRLALRLYLQDLAMESRSRERVDYRVLFWKAIKHWVEIPLFAINQYGIPIYRRFFHQSFPPQWRWNYP